MELSGLVADIDGRLVTPEVKKLFDRMRRRQLISYHRLGVEAARQAVEASVRAQGEPQQVASVTEHSVDGRAGAIPVRLYRPGPDTGTPGTLLVFLHGGGWVTGSVVGSDPFCRAVTNATGCTVASVDYRRAPESAFPRPLHDAIDAVAALAERRGDLGLYTQRLILVGDSAGAHLAASVVAQGISAVTDLALFYPAVRPAVPEAPGSWAENAHDPILPARTMAWFWEQYRGTASLDDPRLALPGEPNGFPRTLVVTCGLDVLRDEGLAFARALASSGADVSEEHYPGMIHGFFSLAKFLPEAAADALCRLDQWLSAPNGRTP